MLTCCGAVADTTSPVAATAAGEAKVVRGQFERYLKPGMDLQRTKFWGVPGLFGYAAAAYNSRGSG